MDQQHPLVRAAARYLDTAKEVALTAARNASGHAALTHRRHLRVATHFTGMGGGEHACSLVGASCGLKMHLVGQCDLVPEAMHAPGLWLWQFSVFLKPVPISWSHI